MLRAKEGKNFDRAITVVECNKSRIKIFQNLHLREALIATKLNPHKDMLCLSKGNDNLEQGHKTETTLMVSR